MEIGRDLIDFIVDLKADWLVQLPAHFLSPFTSPPILSLPSSASVMLFSSQFLDVSPLLPQSVLHLRMEMPFLLPETPVLHMSVQCTLTQVFVQITIPTLTFYPLSFLFFSLTV